MRPIDYSIETFSHLTARLCGLRQEAYAAWNQFGPGTTRQVSALSGMDILTFRPRSTELLQLDLIEIVAGGDGEGIYRAIPMTTARQRFDAAQSRAKRQLALL